MTDGSEFNPFEVSAEVTQEAEQNLTDTLGPDETYRVLRRKILCRSPVELPPVCLAYGETDDLESRHRTLRHPKWWLWLAGIVVIGCLVALGVEIRHSTRPGIPWDLVLMAIVLVAIVAATRRWVWWNGFDLLEITWYVGPRYRWWLKLQKSIGRILVAVLVVVSAVSLFVVPSMWRILPGAVLTLLLGAPLTDHECPLQILNFRKGVFEVGGHRKRFYEVVNGIQRHF
ncbi:MAG: hypothetical protein R3C49_12150 [Planctomycetaceae bacterium]